jgi:hypothetical protein
MGTKHITTKDLVRRTSRSKSASMLRSVCKGVQSVTRLEVTRRLGQA